MNEIDAPLQKLSIRNQKCDNTHNDYGNMIPMCRPYFAGDTKSLMCCAYSLRALYEKFAFLNQSKAVQTYKQDIKPRIISFLFLT